MTGIVLQHLTANVDQKNITNELNINNSYITEVVTTLETLLGETISSNDIAALELVASTLEKDVREFFIYTNSPTKHTNNVMKNLVIDLARQNFTYASKTKNSMPVVVNLSIDQMHALQRNIFDLSNYEKIYSYAAGEPGIDATSLHDVFINPELIGPNEQALLLLTGNTINQNSENFRQEDIKAELRDNLSVELFKRSLPRLGASTYLLLKHSNHGLYDHLPEHYLGVQHLTSVYCYNLSEGPAQLSRGAIAHKCIQMPNPYLSDIPNQALHLKKLTASTSLVESIEIYLKHMDMLAYDLKIDDEGAIFYGSRQSVQGFENLITLINKDVILTRAAITHIDKLCAALADDGFVDNLPTVIDALKNLFSRRNNPYNATPPSASITGLVTRSCIDLPLDGICRLLCLHANKLHDDYSHIDVKPGVKTGAALFAEWMCKNLPDEALCYIAENKLIVEGLITHLLFDREKRTDTSNYMANPEFSIKQMAKVCAIAERSYPKLITEYLELSNIRIGYRSVEKKIGAVGLFDEEFNRQLYRGFDQLSSIEKTDNSAAMTFLSAPTI